MVASNSRKAAWDLCGQLGLPKNPNLPELEDNLVLRSKEEIVSRTLVLNACVAVSFGFPASNAMEWLNSEGLTDSLTTFEQRFLESQNNSEFYQAHVDALYVFSWLLGSYPEIDLTAPLPNSLVNTFPDLNSREPACGFITRVQLRAEPEVLQCLENAYCLDWAICEMRLNGKPNPFHSNIKLRRKALEWAMSSTNWDEVALDT